MLVATLLLGDISRATTVDYRSIVMQSLGNERSTYWPHLARTCSGDRLEIRTRNRRSENFRGGPHSDRRKQHGQVGQDFIPQFSRNRLGEVYMARINQNFHLIYALI